MKVSFKVLLSFCYIFTGFYQFVFLKVLFKGVLEGFYRSVVALFHGFNEFCAVFIVLSWFVFFFIKGFVSFFVWTCCKGFVFLQGFFFGDGFCLFSCKFFFSVF